MPSPTINAPSGDLRVRLIVDTAEGSRPVELASGLLRRRTGDFEFVKLDADRFERTLVMLFAAHVAEAPVSDFVRAAVGQLAAEPGRRKELGRWANRPLYQLMTEDAAASDLGAAQREAAIHHAFEAKLHGYVGGLLESIGGEQLAEDVSDAWQPGEPLRMQRDRILAYGGGHAMSAREVQAFLNVTRTTLANRRREGGLLGLPLGSDRKLVYPSWQFDPRRPTHLVPGLAVVLHHLSGREPWGVADLLTASSPALDGETPIERLLRAGPGAADQVTDIIEAQYV
jgi:hypothetical protein